MAKPVKLRIRLSKDHVKAIEHSSLRMFWTDRVVLRLSVSTILLSQIQLRSKWRYMYSSISEAQIHPLTRWKYDSSFSSFTCSRVSIGPAFTCRPTSAPPVDTLNSSSRPPVLGFIL